MKDFKMVENDSRRMAQDTEKGEVNSNNVSCVESYHVYFCEVVLTGGTERVTVTSRSSEHGATVSQVPSWRVRRWHRTLCLTL